MPDQRIPPTVTGGCTEPGDSDCSVQAAVMTEVLVLHPARLTYAELMREMVGASEDFGAYDQLKRAVCDLIRSGLLHRHGDFVFPTHAIVRFNDLRNAVM